MWVFSGGYVRTQVRAWLRNAQPLSHLGGSVSFLESGVAKGALPCKLLCKVCAETQAFAVF